MEIMQDYQWLKGFNYVPSYARNDIEFWRDYDHDTVQRELEYAKRIGFNCARVFLAYVVYRSSSQKFLADLCDFVRTADQLGIKTIPVVWDSCFSEAEPLMSADTNEWFANPGTMYLDEKYWAFEDAYAEDLVKTLGNEAGLLLWDIHNEPMQTSYVMNYSGEQKEQHRAEIWKFVKHFCDYFHALDPVNSITVGVEDLISLPEIMDQCDVLSFHDYSQTWKGVRRAYEKALQFAEQSGKSIFCSEMGCPGRANPYDIAIEIANEYGVGYVLWELMIGKCFWYDRHGVVYPDGTVRDPSILAAVQGFFRRREGRVEYNVNTESFVTKALAEAEAWLQAENKDADAGLDILCKMANFLESGQLIPDCDLPSVKYLGLEKNADLSEMAAVMKEWAVILKADADAKMDKNYTTLEV